MTKVNYLFRCKTKGGYFIKILVEIISNNIKTGSFTISKKGITLCMHDRPQKTLVFEKFVYNSNQPSKQVGLNLNHFFKILKSIKKKEALELFITRDRDEELNIRTTSKESNHKITTTMKIQNIQSISIDIPTYNINSVIISSSEFQKICKELNIIGSDTIQIIKNKGKIQFIADADDILKRNVEFGDSDSDSESEAEIYNSKIDVDQLNRIEKLSGLSNNIHILILDNFSPILFKTNVGSLGTISIFIKSKELSEE
jgi:hypothetical protein